jgi:YD repeat-containing protein
MKGAPLMRLFKANRPAQSEEDRARDLRLTYIASRHRAERSLAPSAEASMDAAETPQAPDSPQ